MVSLKEDVLYVLYKMHEETRFGGYSTNEEKAIRTVKYCIEHGFFYFDGKCLMLGKISSPWFSDDKTASDMVIYTLKEHRGQGCAEKAVTAFMVWARENNADHICIEQATGVCSKEFESLAKKLGLKKSGSNYNGV